MRDLGQGPLGGAEEAGRSLGVTLGVGQVGPLEQGEGEGNPLPAAPGYVLACT